MTEEYSYDIFGNITSSLSALGNPYYFTGREYDPETGLYYYRARYYSTTVGRFLQTDPLQIDDENPYTYCYNDPVNWVDPYGLQIAPVPIVPPKVEPPVKPGDIPKPQPKPEPKPGDNELPQGGGKTKMGAGAGAGEGAGVGEGANPARGGEGKEDKKKEHRKKHGHTHDKHTKPHSSRNMPKAKKRLIEEGKWYGR